MSHSSVEMYELKVPLAAIRKLSNEQRYVYYLLGHMFNELMFLQKLAGFAVSTMNKHTDRRPARANPEQAQALFLFRMSSAKVWEAVETIRKKDMSMVLRTDIFPHMPDGQSRLDDLNATVSAAKWLPEIRNGMGFHFPTMERWKDFVTPADDWVDDSVYLGPGSGHTFYDGSDAIVKHWMFSQKKGMVPKEGVVPLINEMIELLTKTTNFLEDVMGAFVAEFLLKGKGQGKAKMVGKIQAPQYHSVTLPFWVSMPPAKRAELDRA